MAVEFTLDRRYRDPPASPPDLGSARCDAAVMYGPNFAADVFDGWQRATGRAAENIAYWDAVAALSTPPEMAEFVPPIQGQGRTDLEQPVLAERRDAFRRADAREGHDRWR